MSMSKSGRTALAPYTINPGKMEDGRWDALRSDYYGEARHGRLESDRAWQDSDQFKARRRQPV